MDASKEHITMTIKKNNSEELIQDLIEQADGAHKEKAYTVSFPIYNVVNTYVENYWVLYQLGVYWKTGLHQAANESKAEGYFKEAKTAAENAKEDSALFVLGELYSNGYGVTQDVEKAKSFYAEASKHGHQEATERLEKLNTN